MNRYEAPEIVTLGSATDVILDQKQPDVIMDNLGVPWCTNADTIDDFDE